MTFNSYQQKSRKTAIYPKLQITKLLGDYKKDAAYLYPVLGLVGESGEVAEKIKKLIRDDQGVVTKEKKEEIRKELGDVLWYIAQICTEFNFSMDDVAEENLKKLISRKDRKQLKGSGDNR